MESSDEEKPSVLAIDVGKPQPPSIFRQRADLSDFSFLPRELQLVVDAAPGCGGVTWPAALVLSRYLAHQIQRQPDLYAGSIVLELGSGTGCVALALALLQPKVQRIVATDIDALLPLMRENVSLNRLDELVGIEELSWGESLPAAIPAKVDVLLLADCVYFEPAFPLLVQTMDALLGASTECFFCYKKRRKADKQFFIQARKLFDFSPVGDDPSASLYARESISLYRVRRRRKGGPLAAV